MLLSGFLVFIPGDILKVVAICGITKILSIPKNDRGK